MYLNEILPIYCFFHRNQILNQLRQDLGAEDMKLARQSKTVPHYQYIVNGLKAEKYLQKNLPNYIVTCIAQLRLNYSIIYNKGAWYDLGMFEQTMCVYCGGSNSLAHLFECQSNSEEKNKYLPNCSDFIGLVHKNIKIHDYNNLYYFLCSVLKFKQKK